MEGKTIIITGANGNLGSAVTKEFLDKGYKVIATVVTEAMKNDFAANENLDVQVVNLTSEEETNSFVQTVIDKYSVKAWKEKYLEYFNQLTHKAN